MAGWDLKEGILEEERLSDNEKWEMLLKFLSKKTTMKNLYKIFFFRSLIILTGEDNIENTNLFQKVNELFAELYWNNKVLLNMNITIFNGVSKISKQEKIINEIYKINPNSKYIDFKDLKNDLKDRYLSETKKVLKTNVIGAVYKDFDSKLYSFNLKREELNLSILFSNFFYQNKNQILKLLEYREVEFIKISETNNLKIEKYIQEKLNLEKHAVDFYEVIKNEIFKNMNKG